MKISSDDPRLSAFLLGELPAAEAAAVEHFAPVLDTPVLIDGLALFEEPAPGAPFLATRHFPFPHSVAEVAA